MFRIPTTVFTDPGCSSMLPSLMEHERATKPLIVTDKVIRETDWFGPLTFSCTNAVIADSISPNPRIDEVNMLADWSRENGVDLVVGIGGGSVLDAAKAVAMLINNGGGIRKYVGRNNFAKPSLPFIAVPTTCGTGSEVTWVSVLTDAARNVKISVKGEAMFPQYALSDSTLIRSLPLPLIASTGMDAMTHALEAIVVKPANPASDALAVRAIQLLQKHLVACASPNATDLDRRNVMLASTLAGMAFGNADVGAVHCLSESIGGLLDMPHGLLNALLLVPVFSAQQAHIASRLETRLNMSFDSLMTSLSSMMEALPLPDWASLTIGTHLYEGIATLSVTNGSNVSNRMEMGKEEYLNILQSI